MRLWNLRFVKGMRVDTELCTFSNLLFWLFLKTLSINKLTFTTEKKMQQRNLSNKRKENMNLNDNDPATLKRSFILKSSTYNTCKTEFIIIRAAAYHQDLQIYDWNIVIFWLANWVASGTYLRRVGNEARVWWEKQNEKSKIHVHTTTNIIIVNIVDIIFFDETLHQPNPTFHHFPSLRNFCVVKA